MLALTLTFTNGGDINRYPCVAAGTSCVKAAWYFDDHMSGVEIYGNVVVGSVVAFL
jgi:hypothetical protein